MGIDIRLAGAALEGKGMAELEVPRLTISRVLNHKEGGVTSIYDRHSYFKEKLATLELWY